uniref:Neuromedin U n=1 Tax=Buteo japonicus TaxID=224669 RepID=A0A8C0C1L7_9AVES
MHVTYTCRGAGIQLQGLCLRTASSALEELCFFVMGFLQKPQVTHTKDYLDPVCEVSLGAGTNTTSSYAEMLCVLIQHLLKIMGRLQCLDNNLQAGYKVSGVFIALD